MDSEDYGLSALLDMHNYRFTYDNGYWWKIEAYTVPKTEFRPHGIRYNLTFHDHHNLRIFGMDNAHAIKPEKKANACKVYDHFHKDQNDRGTPYEFTTAEDLLNDFFASVDKIIADLEHSLS